MAVGNDYSADRLTRSVSAAVLAALILAALYYGRDILIPIVLAVLLSFVLSPLVTIVSNLLPRGIAVAAVVAATVTGVALLGLALAHQVIELGSELPRYETTLRQKLQTFRVGSVRTGVIDKATSILKGLSRELEQPQQSQPQVSRSQDQPKPIPVEVTPAQSGPLEIYQRIFSALLGPVTTAGIVLIMVVFILLQRSDIRDRVIRLAGTRDIQRTTVALNDAAERLSRLFLMQTALNAVFGAAVAMGLFVIGVPSPVLWGVLAGLMRFVPYIGSIVSSIFPVLLAASVDPGWSMALETAALFIVLEPLTGNFIEPWLQGHSTGLSPLAIVVAAVLWTTLWGPIGLLIATPITMCLVVLGRHIEGLSFLYVLLGDEPALSPEEIFYQRLLSGSSAEAAEHAEAFLKQRTLLDFADEVALPGLKLAAMDASRGAIDDVKMAEIHDGVQLLLEDVPQESVEAKAQSSDANEENVVSPLLAANVELTGEVLCIGARTSVDGAAAELLSLLLNRRRVPSRAAVVSRLVDIGRLDLENVQLVWLTSINISADQSHARYVLRRLRRIRPELVICGAFWDGSIAALEVNMSANTMREAVAKTIDWVNETSSSREAESNVTGSSNKVQQSLSA